MRARVNTGYHEIRYVFLKGRLGFRFLFEHQFGASRLRHQSKFDMELEFDNAPSSYMGSKLILTYPQ